MEERERVIAALRRAMDQICERAGKLDASYKWKTVKGVRRIVQFNPPDAFHLLHDASERVRRGEMGAEAAMALLHLRDVEVARFGQ